MFTGFESYFFMLDGLEFWAENVKTTVEVKGRYYNGNCFLFETLFRVCTFLSFIVRWTQKKRCKNQKRKKNVHLHVWLHTSAIPDAFEMLSFLTYKFNFVLLCNLILAYFNALENCVAPFQLIRVIPKWLLARMKISERDEVHVSWGDETVKYYELKITYSELKMQTGLALDLGLYFLYFE